VEPATTSKLPSIFATIESVEAGALMSYGQNRGENLRRAAAYVHNIFKGANPADPPVEQPTKVELVINGRTARTLGLTIPQTLLISADKVID
jgi:putative tryptophan/tyrosine transport system substrate-binding protein